MLLVVFTCSIMTDNSIFKLGGEAGVRLVYMYGKEIREGNKKEKGSKRRKGSGKGVETRGKEIRERNEREMRKLSDCSPFNNIQ